MTHDDVMLMSALTHRHVIADLAPGQRPVSATSAPPQCQVSTLPWEGHWHKVPHLLPHSHYCLP